ncbi:MAG TPA: hypothetical protein VFF73_25520 [Planctomycetota bacterium]|nr:hypothetical protein [Planctomycetota bacterium]
MSRLVAFSKRIEDPERSLVRGRDAIDILLEVGIHLEKLMNNPHREDERVRERDRPLRELARDSVELTNASPGSIVASTKLKKHFEKSIDDSEKRLVPFEKPLVEFFGAQTSTHGRMAMMTFSGA